MIATIAVKVNAAKPNFPLQPMFAFQGSPSSIRILDVPKSIGAWAITSVKVAVTYPDNTTVEKVAVRNGSVWVSTIEGCDIAGKVANGYEVLADGKDEDGNDVTGYVLGKGDVFIIEDSIELSRLVGKIAVRYMDEIPDVPTKGDLMNSNGELRLFDGQDWIVISTTEPPPVYDSQITIKKNGTPVGTFTVNANQPKAVDIPVPSNTSDIVNDSGFITVDAIPSDISAFNNDVGYITEAAIPSNVTAFNNDAGYITEAAIPSQVTAFENDAGYITSAALPTKVSELENDSGFITEAAIPSNISSFNNDSGYITENAIPSTVGAFQNDVGYLTSVSWGAVLDKPDVALLSDIPSKVSELDNDEGFITADALPSKVSELQNDAGYITASAIPAIPTKTSDLQNDSGFTTVSAVAASYYNKGEVDVLISNIDTDKIVDADGNTIEADGSCTIVDANGWQVTDPNSNTYYLDLIQNRKWQYVEAETMKIELAYGGNEWELSTYNWTQDPNQGTWDWELDVSGYSPAEGDVTTINDFANIGGNIGYSASRPVTKHQTLATKEYVENRGFITAVAIPSNVSQFNNDAGYITSSAVPSKVSQLTNDAGYLTATSTTITNIQNRGTDHEFRIREVEKQATGAREYMDLSYPTVNADAQDGFGIEYFTLVYPSYNDNPAYDFYIPFYSVESGIVTWRNTLLDVRMKTSDGIHFSYFNNADNWQEFPLNAAGTEVWTHFGGAGIRPAYVTPVFKSSAMKEIALKDYVNAQIASAVPSQVSELQNDAGYITASAIPAIPSKTSELDNDSGFITVSAIPSNISSFNNDAGYITASAVASSYYNKTEVDTSLAGKRGIHDNEIHPISVTDTPFYKVRVDYTDTSTEKMTVVLEKQNGSQLVWLWQDNGQEIELTYSDGYFQLSYQNITDLNNTPHSSYFGNFEITNPDESVTIGDSYFRFIIVTYGGEITTKEYVDEQIGLVLASQF